MIHFDIDDSDPLPEPVPPPGGWRPITCTWESHRWELEVEDGKAHIFCADPCEPLHDPAGPIPICLVDWAAEDFHTPEPLRVALTFVNDSTPSTPAGPAEYGYYIEVRPMTADGPAGTGEARSPKPPA